MSFGEFLSPVSQTSENETNAGRTIPIKWTVTGADVDDASVVEARLLSDGATYASLRLGETWHFNAQTPQAWAGTVQTFRVVLSSGSVHEAVFRFR